MERWRASLKDKNASLGRVRALLRNGFLGDATPEHLQEVTDILLENPRAAEKMAVLLATQKRVGKLSPFSHSVLERVRSKFAATIEYYSDDFGGAKGAFAIDHFVETSAPRRRGDDPQRQSGTAEGFRTGENASTVTPDSWLRRFFVCLCAETEPTVFINGTIAAGKWWLTLHSNAFAAARGDADLARAVCNAICASDISKPKLELIFTGIAPLQQQFTLHLNRELDLMRRIQHRDDAIGTLKRENAHLESALATSQDETAAARAQVSELKHLLTEAAEKHRLLDQHWRAVSEQNLNKQGGSYRERIGHELQEALLSLGRETPNVAMGLVRLKRIEAILKDEKS
jgi:F0F1-type ATP synthase membrane subunit b/b'